MSTIELLLCGALTGAVVGVAGAYLWLVWYFRDVYK